MSIGFNDEMCAISGEKRLSHEVPKVTVELSSSVGQARIPR